MIKRLLRKISDLQIWLRVRDWVRVRLIEGLRLWSVSPISFPKYPFLLVSNREERELWERSCFEIRKSYCLVLNLVLVRSEGRYCLSTTESQEHVSSFHLAMTCDSIWARLAITCMWSLGLSWNLRASWVKFFLVCPPNATRPKFTLSVVLFDPVTFRKWRLTCVDLWVRLDTYWKSGYAGWYFPKWAVTLEFDTVRTLTDADRHAPDTYRPRCVVKYVLLPIGGNY